MEVEFAKQSEPELILMIKMFEVLVAPGYCVMSQNVSIVPGSLPCTSVLARIVSSIILANEMPTCNRPNRHY